MKVEAKILVSRRKTVWGNEDTEVCKPIKVLQSFNYEKTIFLLVYKDAYQTE